jgi:microcystin-dependent protein
MAVGQIIWMATQAAPGGTLACDGAQYNTVDYPVLFAAIGYTWGGSGAVFNVPDLREKFLFGADEASDVGDVGGEMSHQLTTDEMPTHRHQVAGWGVGVAQSGAGVTVYTVQPGNQAYTMNTGTNQPHNNMPPYTTLLPCIVAE